MDWFKKRRRLKLSKEWNEERVESFKLLGIGLVLTLKLL